MPELGTIVRRCPLLAMGVVTHLVTRFRGRFCLTTWMQTNGRPLLAVKKCSLARMRMAAQDGSCAPGLLYAAAVLPPASATGRAAGNPRPARGPHARWATLLAPRLIDIFL